MDVKNYWIASEQQQELQTAALKSVSSSIASGISVSSTNTTYVDELERINKSLTTGVVVTGLSITGDITVTNLTLDQPVSISAVPGGIAVTSIPSAILSQGVAVTAVRSRVAVSAIDERIGVSALDTRVGVSALDVGVAISALPDVYLSRSVAISALPNLILSQRAALSAVDSRIGVSAVDTRVGISAVDTRIAISAFDVGVAVTSMPSHVHIQQDVTTEAANSSTTNLDSGNSYTFTGASASTLGVNAIQVVVFANKNVTVQVQQSNDGENWDVVDKYYYVASTTDGGYTVQAVGAYYRVVATTNTETTTTFRLSTVLCPIVEALPRSLDVNGNLRVTLQKDVFGNAIENSPNGEMQVVQKIRLVGTTFDGNTIDPNFWTTSSSGGSVTQSGAMVTLNSGTSAGHYALIHSVRRARFVTGSTPKMRIHFRTGDTGTANVMKRWGCAWGSTSTTAITDGCYFELSGTTLNVVTMKGGTTTKVASGVFNGQLGYTYTPTTNNTVYEIMMMNGAVSFIVGGVLLHKASFATTTWTNTLNLQAYADVRAFDNVAAKTMEIRSFNISRIGALQTLPSSTYVSAAGLTVAKYGAGVLHRAIINDGPNGSAVTFYDNTTSAGTILTLLNTSNVSSPISLELGIPFYNGLAVQTTLAVQHTFVYE